MKNIIIALLFIVVMSFSAEVQILAPTGADFQPDAPNIVSSLVRAAVAQTGNIPVEKKADIQIRTNLMTMGNSIVVVCEQIDDGAIVGSGKQKAVSIDELDVAIEEATKQAFNFHQNNSDDSYNEAIDTYEHSNVSNEDLAEKRPTHNYSSYGLGIGIWHNYEHSPDNKKMEWDQAYVFHYAKIFETGDHGAITILNNLNFTVCSNFEFHETMLIGGRFYLGTNFVSPFAGLGLGLGFQLDKHYDDASEYFAFGLATGAEIGLVFFRNSSIQLEFGVAWDALWDGFEAFERRFGAGSFYVALNF